MTMPPASFVRLSTDQFAERDRIEAAREIIGRSLMKMEFELLPDVPFNVDMVFRALPDFAMASGICSAMDCLRTPELIESNGLILTVALSGGAILHVRGEEIQMGGGMAALTRTADVSRCAIHSTSEFVNFRFPFDKISPLIADLDAAVMRPIPVNTEALRLLVHYASMLKDSDMLATPEVQNLVSTHLHDLAALTIGATRDAAIVAVFLRRVCGRSRPTSSKISPTVFFRSRQSLSAKASRHVTSACCLRAMRRHFQNSY